jgi:hypothetical protein
LPERWPPVIRIIFLISQKASCLSGSKDNASKPKYKIKTGETADNRYFCANARIRIQPYTAQAHTFCSGSLTPYIYYTNLADAFRMPKNTTGYGLAKPAPPQVKNTPHTTHSAKHGLPPPERPRFSAQKAIFRKLKHGLLQKACSRHRFHQAGNPTPTPRP